MSWLLLHSLIFCETKSTTLIARFCFVIVLAVTTLLVGNAFAAPPLSQKLIGVGTSIKDSPAAVEVANSVGFNSIRIDAPWAEIERSEGVYKIPEWLDKTVNLSLKYKMKPMLILAYGNSLYGGDKPKSTAAINAFAKYTQFVMTHFKNKVMLYQVWNEWHAHTGKTTPGSAAEYISLLKKVYPVIKAANPENVVVASSFSTEAMDSGWADDFISLNGYQYTDVMSIHPYVYMYSGKQQTPEHAIDIVDILEAKMKKVNGNIDYPIYITEFGYPTNEGRFGINEYTRANYLKEFFSFAKSRQYIHGVWWYGLYDQGDDVMNKEHRFGLYGRDSKIKPTGLSLKTWLSNN